jgi:murein DD-endopeptidase MepM/ murein hydrolase activator NlpD
MPEFVIGCKDTETASGIGALRLEERDNSLKDGGLVGKAKTVAGPAKTPFTQMLVRANGIDPNAFCNLVFWPGMLFNSMDKWWGDYGRRDFPHEGVDVCLYQDTAGQIHRLGENARIPVMHAGVVRALFTDYLGQAVILEHDLPAGPSRLLSVYAHTQPLAGIEPGVSVAAGDIIATIADTSRSKTDILPHLHLSFGTPSMKMVYEPFVWDSMRDPEQVALLDPLGVIG